MICGSSSQPDGSHHAECWKWVNTFLCLLHWLGSSGSTHGAKFKPCQSRDGLAHAITSDSLTGTFLWFKSPSAAQLKRPTLMCVCLAEMWCVINQIRRVTVFSDPVSEACSYQRPGWSFSWCKCSRTCQQSVRFHMCTLLPSLASSICLIHRSWLHWGLALMTWV